MTTIEFAPDGEHWQVIKRGNLAKMWDYFIGNVDIRRQIAINPSARFRLTREEKVIGVLGAEK